MGKKEEAIALLQADRREDRLRGLAMVEELIEDQIILPAEPSKGEVNNHVHTRYSFSPYYPSMATFLAWNSGLETVGCIDHDSMGGALEMAEAGEFIGMATTLGFEVRVDFSDSLVGDRKINNPDSKGIVYMVIHGVPRHAIPQVQEFLLPIGKARTIRNRAQLEKLNTILEAYNLQQLDFDTHVLPLSESNDGGSITERHILFALAASLVEQWGVGAPLVEELKKIFNITIPSSLEKMLLDSENPYYLYDLLGILKASFLPRFFIQPNADEAIPAERAVRFAKEIGAIPAYAYLGDIAESPTGDKKAEAFEDSFLEELFQELHGIGFLAVTYMPPRNSSEQLARVQKLCKEHNFMEISGVDINSPRQSFLCPELRKSQYSHLNDSAWALIAHEQLLSQGDQFGLFAPNSPQSALPISERVALYATYGRSLNLHNPRESAKLLLTQGGTLWT